MKGLVPIVAVLTTFFATSLTAAHDKVVVIPLNSTKKISQVVTVFADKNVRIENSSFGI